jgi:large subunit ribosomal protein L30e
MVDVNKVFKDVAKKGKLKMGEKQTKLSISDGSAKLVVVSNNCPYTKEITDLANKKNISIYNYNSNGIELGYACGKNFVVSSFAVIDEGESNIMQLVKKRK